MHNATIFTGVAQQHGFSPEAARATLDRIEASLLHQKQSADTVFYVYRTGGGRTAEESGTQERSRLLLAFPSADGAFAFAQHHGLASTPRLRRMSVAQLLAILVQHPSISALIFVNEMADVPLQHTLPSGIRLERTGLLAMLQGG